ncbi:Hypothetical protein MVR_LOCUS290 [uncultured virus]|nr:Hypothetical protein MVR_LOCUS290 [uncultured virus]
MEPKIINLSSKSQSSSNTNRYTKPSSATNVWNKYANTNSNTSKSAYVRPEQTKQDMLTDQEIEEALLGFVKVDTPDIKLIPLGTEIRYITKDKDGKMKFRYGGQLVNNTNYDTYIMLTNHTASKPWSVQVESSIVFRKMTLKELRDHYESKIAQLEAQVESQKAIIAKLTAATQSNKN